MTSFAKRNLRKSCDNIRNRSVKELFPNGDSSCVSGYSRPAEKFNVFKDWRWSACQNSLFFLLGCNNRLKSMKPISERFMMERIMSNIENWCFLKRERQQSNKLHDHEDKKKHIQRIVSKLLRNARTEFHTEGISNYRLFSPFSDFLQWKRFELFVQPSIYYFSFIFAAY